MRHTVFCVLSVLITIVLALVSLRYFTDFWLLSLVYSFQIHLSVVCAVAAIVALVFKRHWYGFLMLAVATFLNIHGVIMLREFAGKTPAEDAPRLFRLMSFNIENDNFDNGERIADAILASGADVGRTSAAFAQSVSLSSARMPTRGPLLPSPSQNTSPSRSRPRSRSAKWQVR